MLLGLEYFFGMGSLDMLSLHGTISFMLSTVKEFFSQFPLYPHIVKEFSLE